MSFSIGSNNYLVTSFRMLEKYNDPGLATGLKNQVAPDLFLPDSIFQGINVRLPGSVL